MSFKGKCKVGVSMTMHFMSFRLGEEDEDIILDWAKKLGISKSAIIRMMIRFCGKYGLWNVVREVMD